MPKLYEMEKFDNSNIKLGTMHLHKGQMSLEEVNARLKLDGVSEFPVYIFPPFIQDVIIELYENANYSIDYISASILTAIAGSIGNSYHLKANLEWSENAALWMVIVGKSGQNKSAPVKTAFRAISEQQKRFDAEYEASVSNYDPDSGDKKPKRKKLYSTDPTFEALVKMHKDNPNGLVLKPDEFKSFINNMVGYRGNSKQSNYLSLWDMSPVYLDRKDAESLSLNTPCVCIIGGIQDEVLASLKSKDIKDGFYERLLYVIPKQKEKKLIKQSVLDEHIIGLFHSRMNSLLQKIADVVNTQVIEMSEDANRIFVAEQNKHIKASNKDDRLSGILAKLDRYVLRFALILEVSERIFAEEPVFEISTKNMYRAIQLKDYFFNTALELNGMILNVYENNSLEGKVLKVIKAINKECFTIKEFISMAEKLGIAKESYAYKILSQSKLTTKVHRGVYETDVLG